MIIERRDNEILVRFTIGQDMNKIQTILDYLKYEELTSKSNVSQEDLEMLLSDAKSGRWQKAKNQIGLND